MIFINEDKAIQKNYRINAIVKYKGKMSNTLLVIEDVIDMSKKNPENHQCICKCLECGKIYPRLVAIRQIREKKARCTCTGMEKRYKFLDKKGKMLYFLMSEKNKAEHEMVFAEDAKRVAGFDMVIKFLGSKSLKNYFKQGIDLQL